MSEPIKEVVYQSAADTLQVWLRWDRPSFNRHVEDGLYEIVDLGDETVVLGYEIVNFRNYASTRDHLRQLAETFDRLPGEAVVWREPSPSAGARLLPHAS